MDDGMAFPSSPFLASRSEEGQLEASTDGPAERGTREEGGSNPRSNGGSVDDGNNRAQDGSADGVGKAEGPGKDRQPAKLAGLWGGNSRSGYRD